MFQMQERVEAEGQKTIFIYLFIYLLRTHGLPLQVISFGYLF